MSYCYIPEEKIIQSVQNFSTGNVFDLFELTITNLYDSREILKNPTFILNIFKNFTKHDERIRFSEILNENRINLLQDYTIDLTNNFSETNSEILNKYQRFWDNKMPNPAPLIFFLIPYLEDEQISKIIRDSSFYNIVEHPFISDLTKNTISKFYKLGFTQSLESLKEQYFFVRGVDLSAQEKNQQGEDVSFSDILWESVLTKPKLLMSYAHMIYTSTEALCDRWFNHHLYQNEIPEALIEEFITELFPYLNVEEKENVISHTLNRTSNLSLCKKALKEIGITNFSDYKPKKYPIWIQAGCHKNNKVFAKLLKSEIDLFDYYPPGNKVFLSTIFENSSRRDLKKSLEERKVDYNTIIKRLLQERIDENGKKFTNFSLLCTTGESTFHDILNLKKEEWPLLSKSFNPEKYNNLSSNKKTELLNSILDKTFLAETYIPEGIFYKKHLELRAINLNIFINNEYNPNSGIHLIDEHLSLLAENQKYDYTEKYFKAVSQLFDVYSIRSVPENSEAFNTYIKMIDYVATNKNLNWNELYTFLCSEKIEKDLSSYDTGAKTLFSYLKKVSLSYSLPSHMVSEKKKLKI